MRVASLLCLVALATCGADPGPGESVGGGAAVSGARLKLQFLEGADGSRLPQGLWDAERNEACEPMVDEAGTTRCFPRSTASTATIGGTYFADAACSRVALDAVAVECSPPRYIIRAETRACPPRWRVFRVVAKLPGAYFIDGDGACAQRTGPETTFYSIEPIPSSAFVALTRKAL